MPGMTHRHAGTAILGAGAMGSAAAYHLARRGEPFVLIDRFSHGHSRGSSGGAARIARHSYADADHARLMVDAFRAWRELERDSCRTLFHRTGTVSTCPPTVDYVARVAASLAAVDVPHRRMSGAELNRRVPAFGLAGDADVVFEPDAGLIAAAGAIAAEVEFAREVGGARSEFRFETRVGRIDLEGERPTLILDGGEVLAADRLIVAAGPWTARLLPSLAFGLRPTRQQVLYFRPEDPAPFEVGRFPAFIAIGESDRDACYAMPAALGMGVKAARHWGPDADPDVDDPAIDPDYVEGIRRFLAATVPALASAPIDRAEVCYYTMAEDERFRLGPLPGRPDVVVASPCSGHGFKFSCMIGRVLADLAIDGETAIAVAPWRI